MSGATRRSFLEGAVGLAAARRPNLLLLYPDQHRFDWLGGRPDLPVSTPHLDWLAARGARFEQAIVGSPLCAPSRACLASGRDYDRCRVPSNSEDFPLDQLTYYRLLRDAGYHVTGCGKFDLHKGSPSWGIEGRHLLEEWGFSDGIDNAGKIDAINSGAERPKDPYMHYLHQRGLAAAHVADFRKRQKLGYQATFATPLDEEAYCDNWIAANGLKLLRRVPPGRPWHLVVNFTGPHSPMDITPRMEKLVRGRRFRQPNGSREYTPEVHNTIRQNYTAMVENLDRLVGLLLDELKRRDELDNTLIVFSSDHGEMLGDHNRWGKSVPYQPSIAVPLIVAGPGVKRGLRSRALVSHIDIAATFLDWAGIRQPREMDARSLRAVLEGRTRSHREHALSGLRNWRAVLDGRYKLIRGFDPAGPLLFDLDADPLEHRNLAAEAPEMVKRLSKLLPAG